MPPANIACLAPAIKTILEHEARHIEDQRERQAFLELLEDLADCPKGMLIGVEPGRKSTRAKRAPSEYNKFLKSCASSKAKGGRGLTFKACSDEWKQSHAK